MKLPINYDKLSPTERQVVREEYIKQQNGLCYHCKAPLSGPPKVSTRINKKLFPENFFKWPIHLHHSHDNGMTIGAVHCHCNAILWQYHGE